MARPPTIERNPEFWDLLVHFNRILRGELPDNHANASRTIRLAKRLQRAVGRAAR